MRIIQLIDAPRRRGAEVFASQLTRGLEERGNEVKLIAIRSATEVDDELTVDATLVAEAGRGLSWSVARKLVDLARSMGADIVQANGGSTPKHAALAKAIDRRAGWKLVYRNIGDPRFWLSNPVKRAIYRHFVWSTFDGVVSVSEHARQGLHHVYGKKGPPIEVIYQGVDTTTLAPAMSRIDVRGRLSTPESAVVVVWVGALSGEKRPDRALRVMFELVRNGTSAVLWMVGAGPLAEEMRSLSRDLNVVDHVRWVGSVNDVGTYLHAADVFLLTSDTEGVPGALLEAMMVGLPAVAANVGGIEEVLQQGSSGFLCEPDDEGQFVHRAELLARDPALRRTVGDTARREAENRFDMAHGLRRYDAFFRTVLRGH